MNQKRKRCAIYTRKSSEEGLEQNFNSLEAQREACEAYITSQAHEGWRAIKTRFDDGGLSGGTLDRPALITLLAEIRAKRVEIVVIYKIDRLTRSLIDFGKLAELFDEHGVSFVSVTQQFNTTTSMGRLMLNVLLSFAQFEREITGERIRDKIAASKKKGMWMGGSVPIGYDAVDRKLVINKKEASTVKTVFSLYLKLRNVKNVWLEATRRNLVSKQRCNAAGETKGGLPLWRGHIYKILRNPIYAGWIAHKDELHEGEHTAIIDRDSWNQAQDLLTANARRKNIKNRSTSPGLLVGRLYDSHGHRMTHTHSSTKQRRYRYYATNADEQTASDSIVRIPASQIESRIKETILELLRFPTELTSKLSSHAPTAKALKSCIKQAATLTRTLANAGPGEWVQFLDSCLSRVTVDTDTLTLVINQANLAERLAIPHPDNGSFEHRVACKFINRGGQLKLIIRPEDESLGGVDATLIKSVTRAHAWYERLRDGRAESIRDIAEQENLSAAYVMRYLRLAFLAPDIVEAILKGKQPPGISVRRLTNNKQLPSNWAEQRRLLNFPAA